MPAFRSPFGSRRADGPRGFRARQRMGALSAQREGPSLLGRLKRAAFEGFFWKNPRNYCGPSPENLGFTAGFGELNVMDMPNRGPRDAGGLA